MRIEKTGEAGALYKSKHLRRKALLGLVASAFFGDFMADLVSTNYSQDMDNQVCLGKLEFWASEARKCL